MKHKFALLLLTCVVELSKFSSGNSDISEGFGYEMLQFQFEHLQNSQNEMTKELGQMNKQQQTAKITLEKHNSLLEQLLGGILVIVNNTIEISNHIKREMSHKDCSTAINSGLFKIKCDDCPTATVAYCEMKSFGGGWLVVQQRLDGSLSFNQSWTEYRNGFGTPGKSTEFWLGLELLHKLTTSGDYELAIELKDEKGTYEYARYSDFQIAGELEKYELTHLGNYTGTFKKDFSQYHKNLKFTTFDNKNDNSKNNCAIENGGGWWYEKCSWVNPNAKYIGKENGVGIHWGTQIKIAKFSRMLIRRK